MDDHYRQTNFKTDKNTINVTNHMNSWNLVFANIEHRAASKCEFCAGMGHSYKYCSLRQALKSAAKDANRDDMAFYDHVKKMLY